MTYPPQDPGSSSGPAYPGGDQYGQSQPGQPPAGGYAPGQYSAPQYPTSQQPVPGYGQYPGHADPSAQYQPQPGYGPPPPGYQDPYAYGAPPVQPTSGSSTTAILIIVVVVLMAVGGAAGYFLLGGDKDEGTIGASDDQTSATTETSDEETGEETGPEPSGSTLTVASLGAVTPSPGPEWSPYYGPGENYGLANDSEAYFIQHTDTWISYFSVGIFSNLAAPYDPADLRGSAQAATSYWLEDAFESTVGFVQGEITYTNVEVDGRPGVLAEWHNSWQSSANTDDLFEDTALLVVDVDGVNGFVGVASTSEAAADLYGPALDALLATDFDAETA